MTDGTMTMRVLHVHSGNLYGGVESLLVTLIEHESASSVQSAFALAFDEAFAAELRKRDAPVHAIGAARLSRPWMLRRARRRLAAVIRDARPALIVCHSRWSQILAGREPRRAGVPFAIWLHAAPTGLGWQERWAARYAVDFAICNSEWTSRAARQHHPDVPTAVVHPPVAPLGPIDPNARREIRRKYGADERTVVVLQAGRIEPGKGLLEHVRALAELRALPEWRLWVAGAPQRPPEERYFHRVHTAVADGGIGDRVVFFGETRDVAPLYRAADVYCQPNVEPESFGITFVEALHAGLPVLTSDLGAAGEILTPDCGIRVRRADIVALRDALRSLIADQPLRARLGAAGPARAAAVSDPDRQARAFGEAVRAAVTAAGSGAEHRGGAPVPP